MFKRHQHNVTKLLNKCQLHVWPHTLSKTSQLPTAPSTGLRLGSWPPSMLSLRRHSSSVCESSVGQARVRARSCSRDSELWTPREHSWSCASASLQLETMEAFTQRCWLWHSDSMAQSQEGEDGDWVSGRRQREKGKILYSYQQILLYNTHTHTHTHTHTDPICLNTIYPVKFRPLMQMWPTGRREDWLCYRREQLTPTDCLWIPN